MNLMETARTIIRLVTKDDINNIYYLLSDSDIIKTLNMPLHKNIEDTEALVEEYLKEYEEGNKYPFAIIDKETNQFIGVFLIKLDLFDEDCFEYTVYLDKNYWGKGICTEVLPYMEKVAFEDIKTGNFRGFIKEQNGASRKVLEKCGFKLEKIFQVEGIDGNIESYLKTREEYLKSKK